MASSQEKYTILFSDGTYYSCIDSLLDFHITIRLFCYLTTLCCCFQLVIVFFLKDSQKPTEKYKHHNNKVLLLRCVLQQAEIVHLNANV